MLSPFDYDDDAMEGNGRLLRKKCQLNTEDLSEIVKSVRELKLSHKEAAIKHRVSSRLVSKLVSGSKVDPNFLKPIRDKE